MFLASRACILPCARVGAWAFLGAGTVVLKRVTKGTMVFGSPAAPLERTAVVQAFAVSDA